jgi:hypothetical protein
VRWTDKLASNLIRVTAVSRWGENETEEGREVRIPDPTKKKKEVRKLSEPVKQSLLARQIKSS